MSTRTFFKCRSAASPLGLAGKVDPLNVLPLYLSFIVIFVGLCHLKEIQDADLPPALHYIRYIAEIPLSTMTAHEEDDSAETAETGELLRMIICMTRESSERLVMAQYLQSDIAFKRVAGFLEFEIGGSDQNAKIGLYCFVWNSMIIYIFY
jgi:hypothetical protein